MIKNKLQTKCLIKNMSENFFLIYKISSSLLSKGESLNMEFFILSFFEHIIILFNKFSNLKVKQQTRFNAFIFENDKQRQIIKFI